MNTALRRKPPLPSHHMTVDEFIDWTDRGRWELAEGEPRAMAPANATHGTIQTNVGYTLTRHLRETGSVCRAVTEPPIIPRVRARTNLRVPDVAVTCSPIEAGQFALPDPVLIVEILSPSNETQTWGNVWTYVTIPSVLEVLVLRSASMSAELLRRLPDGSWPEEPQPVAADAILRLESVDLTCPLAEFYIGTHLARRA